jgi:hypothetical protein
MVAILPSAVKEHPARSVPRLVIIGFPTTSPIVGLEYWSRLRKGQVCRLIREDIGLVCSKLVSPWLVPEFLAFGQALVEAE